MDAVVNKLKNIIPDIKFVNGQSFRWSPATQTITYPPNFKDRTVAIWSLLHETGHAILHHRDYSSDVELLLLEVNAWGKAKEIGHKLHINIDENHVQDCIDTYRDWLHQRGTCPRCGVVSLQINSHTYRCHNCACEWHVTTSRFCRPYRLTKINTKRPLPVSNVRTATFL